MGTRRGLPLHASRLVPEPREATSALRVDLGAIAHTRRPVPSVPAHVILRHIASRVPLATERQLAPILRSPGLAREIGRHVAQNLVRRDPPPTLYSRDVPQPNLRGGEEWGEEDEERQQLGFGPPQSSMPDPAWLEENAGRWAEEAAAEIRRRLETESRAADATTATGGSGLGQASDPAWVDEVIEQLTGVAYESAHPYAAPQAEWREAYSRRGSYPPVLVCDQLGEIIQFIRGLRNYGAGLTAHMEHYHEAGDLHQGNVPAHPGVTLFHVVGSGKSHVMEIEPGSRVPLTASWSRASRVAAIRAESRLLGGPWRADRLRSARDHPDRSADVQRVDTMLDAIYDAGRTIQHETTIIRTQQTPRGGHLIQLFDFDRGIAQEGTRWLGLNTYNSAEYYWGYQSMSETRSLARPQGTGTITISLSGDTLAEIPIEEGNLLPLARYRAVLAALPYSDMLDITLRIRVRQGETMELSARSGGRPRMRDLTPPH